MKRLGAYLAILGIATLALPYTTYELRFFSALDDMGTKGLLIKIAMVVVGVALYLKGVQASKAEEQLSEDN